MQREVAVVQSEHVDDHRVGRDGADEAVLGHGEARARRRVAREAGNLLRRRPRVELGQGLFRGDVKPAERSERLGGGARLVAAPAASSAQAPPSRKIAAPPSRATSAGAVTSSGGRKNRSTLSAAATTKNGRDGK